MPSFVAAFLRREAPPAQTDDGVVPGRPGGGAVVRVAADDDGVVPGRLGEGATVTNVVLDVADDDALEGPVER